MRHSRTNRRTVAVANHMPSLEVPTEEIIALFHSLDALPEPDIPDGELSVAFLPASTMAELHLRFFDDPEPTDVITFVGELSFAGEICVGVEAAVVFAHKHGLPFAEELCRYLIHGWLHLAGYRDDSTHAHTEMRQAEDALLGKITAAGKQPRFSISPTQHCMSD